jgi:molybdopterin molybdotransferase
MQMSGATTEARILGFVEALEVVLRHAAKAQVPGGVEHVALLASAGRVLAEEVGADRDQPPFDRATRDGFAVRAEGWTSGKKLSVVGQVRAGEAWVGVNLASGEAIEIMTGAAVPTGANAVVMIEHAEQGGDEVWAAVGRSLRAGENIVRRGSEARQGEILLAAGTAMGAAEIALAAACGWAEIAVHKRPVVAIVATGDELVEVDQTPDDQQIRNSNGYALAALVEAAGGQPQRLEIARDTPTDVQERVAEGRKSDLLLLSGGVSAGKYDLVEEVLAEFGAESFFTGVRMQPGKPLVFGRVRKSESASQQVSESADEREWTYFFGLPGTPVSTQVTFHCFVEPMLRAMCGAGVMGPKFVQATLAEDVGGKAGLTRLLPAFLRHNLVQPEVRLVGWQGSGDQVANARANCYAVLPDGRDLKAGDVITVLLR